MNNEKKRNTKVIIPIILVLVGVLVCSMFIFIYFKKDKKDNLLSLNIPDVFYAGNEVEFLPIENEDSDTVYEFVSDNNEVVQFEYQTLSSGSFSNAIIAKNNGKANVKVYAVKDNTKVSVYEKELLVCSSFDDDVFSTEEYIVSVGKTIDLNVDLSKYKECYDNLSYTSLDTDIATVSKNGIITALKEGNATIKVSNGTSSIYTEVVVVPVSLTVPVESIKTDTSSISLKQGETSQIKVNILPSNATNKLVSYKSSDEDIVEVSNKGLIKAIKTGSAVVTVISQDSNKSVNINVSVVKNNTSSKDDICKKALSSKLSKTKYSLSIGEYVDINTFDSSVDDLLTWSSTKPAIAKVDRYGNVSGLKEGTANIEISCNNKKYYTVEVQVTEIKSSVKATKITLSPSSLTLSVGTTKDVVANITPKNATVKTLKWISLDSTIAKVNNKGQVTGVKAGKTVINVFTIDGAVAASMDVEVKSNTTTPSNPTSNVAVKSIKAYPSSIQLMQGSTSSIEAVVLPSNASNTNVVYTSLDKSVATVSKTGVVKAVKEGNTKIKISSSSNSSIYTYVNVNVKGNSVNKSVSCSTIFKDENNKKITNTNSINTSKVSIEVTCNGQNTNLSSVLISTNTSSIDSSSVRTDKVSSKTYKKYAVIYNKNNNKKGNHIITVSAADSNGEIYKFTSSITIVGDGSSKVSTKETTDISEETSSECPKIKRVNTTLGNGSITFNAYITKEAKNVKVYIVNLDKGTRITKTMSNTGMDGDSYYYRYTLSTIKGNRYEWYVAVEDPNCSSKSNTYTRTSS